MKTALRTLRIIAIVAMVGSTAAIAGQNVATVTALPEIASSSAPVFCGKANAVKPLIVSESSSPCPGKVYCGYPGGPFGEYCCEWGYFYSNNCDGRCYRTSDDAGKNCSSYFRCN